MEHRLAGHFRAVRLSKGLTLGKLAGLVGYRNISKGANRIKTFEDTGGIHADLLAKLSDALGIDRETVKRLAEEDRREFVEEWNAWANEPIRPYLVVRLMAAVYNRVELPDDIETPEEAEAYAAAVCKKLHMRGCLVLSRRISVWLAADGTVESVTEAVPGKPNTPVTFIGGKSVTIQVKDHRLAFQKLSWPKREGIKGDLRQ